MRRPLCLRASTAWLVLLLAALQLPCHEGLTVRICIPYPEGESSSFRDRCTAAVSTANTEELEFECVAGGSVDNCVDQIADGKADLTTLDGSDVIQANRDHEIVPLISEIVEGGVQGGSYYAVAVVNKEFCSGRIRTLADLKGRRSCHTGYRKSAGWRIPVGTLLNKVDGFISETEDADIEDDAELVANFFDDVCAPRLSGNGPMNTETGTGAKWEKLCTGCKGDCSTNDQYYDYDGAFRCLMEGRGDVAFVKHTTVTDYAEEGALDIVKRAWANKTRDEFRLLCRDGGCAEVTEFRDCHLSVAPSHAMVTSKDFGYGGVNETVGLDIQNAILEANDMFLTETSGLLKNFLWSSEVQGLDAVSKGMETYVPSEALDTYDAFEDLAKGNFALSKDTPVSAIHCSYNDAEFAFCEQVVALEVSIDSEIKWGCIQRDSIEACLEAIAEGDADWRTVSGADAYLGFARYGLTSILAEGGTLGNGYDYYSVAVVKSEFCNDDTTIADLKGVRSCHTGYRKNAGWDIPVGAMVSLGIMEIVSSNDGVNNDAESVAQFFSESCAPYRENITPVSVGEYAPLCTMCRDNCTSSSPYEGYDGAHLCLKEDAGDVAFVKHTTVFEHDNDEARSGLRLVCPDTPGCVPVGDYEDCNLGLVPARSVVVSNDNLNKVVLKRRLLAASQTDEFMDLVFDNAGNSGNLIFNSDEVLIELNDGTEDFLGETVEIFEALEELNSERVVTVKVCIPYPADDSEVESCDNLFESVDIPDVAFKCIKGGTTDACMKQLETEEAHLTTLDGGDVFRGHRVHNIVPLISEVGPGGIEGAYYSVAVVNEGFCDETISLADLEGERSCHTGYRKTAGWRIPVGTLLSEVDAFTFRGRDNSIEDDAELVAKFFDDVCAPRLSGNGPKNTKNGTGAKWDKLCTGCKGDCSTNDQYYNYDGAFRCLMEGRGDVAFVKHTTVPEYAMNGTRDIVQRAWATKAANEFRLLCRDGGCAEVDEYEDCHLALVPSHAIVGVVSLGSNGELSELGEAIKEGITAATESGDFLKRARGLINDFPFSPSTESVKAIEGGYDGYITDEAETAFESFASLVDNERKEGPRQEATFCASTEAQMEACEANIESVYIELEPDMIWSCVQEDSVADCLQALDDGEANFMAGNAAEIYEGSQDYKLRPIAGEAIGPNGETSIYSVILVKSEDCDSNKRLYISNYLGAAACFSGFGTSSGWNTPISIMAAQGLLGIVSNENATSNAVASVLNFFNTVCAPHDEDDDASDRLCSACTDNCSLSGDDSGAAGAVNCLMNQDKGVAITDSTVFLRNAQEGVSLICPYRTGCANTSQVTNCNFGETPTDAIVVSQNADSAFVSRLQSVLVQSSLDTNYESILGTTRDSGHLVAFGGSMDSFLQEYDDTMRTISKIETKPGSYSSTSLQLSSGDNSDDDEGDDEGSDEGDD